MPPCRGWPAAAPTARTSTPAPGPRGRPQRPARPAWSAGRAGQAGRFLRHERVVVVVHPIVPRPLRRGWFRGPGAFCGALPGCCLPFRGRQLDRARPRWEPAPADRSRVNRLAGPAGAAPDAPLSAAGGFAVPACGVGPAVRSAEAGAVVGVRPGVPPSSLATRSSQTASSWLALGSDEFESGLFIGLALLAGCRGLVGTWAGFRKHCHG